MTQFLLDYHGDVFPPTGCRIVRTEVEFLRHALGESFVLVRGEALCQWAEEFCRGRGLAYDRMKSPVEALRAACPGLTPEQAKLLLADLGDRYTELPHPLESSAILKTLYPYGPWQGPLGHAHAARWLLWLSETVPASHLEPLLMQQTHTWQQGAEERERPLYAITEGSEATSVLRRWFGLDAAIPPEALDIFPLDVPDRWKKEAREHWTSVAAREGGCFFHQMRLRPMPRSLLEIAAQVCYDYYRAHPAALTTTDINVLAGYLTEQELLQLQEHCPPEYPGEVPDSSEEVLRWFQERYLPYRRWQVVYGDDEAKARIDHLARRFGEWCLEFYPPALSGGSGREHLSVFLAKELRESRADYVTLWVILDGLPYTDAMKLSQLLLHQPRLSLETLRATFAPLPTITRFCKNALMNGVPAQLVGEENPAPTFEGAILLPENKDPADAVRAAALGDVYVWSLLEPDRTYHRLNDPKIIQMNVEGQLRTLAGKIIHAAMAVPSELPLRLCLSTDHGRLLTYGQRQHAWPTGMKAEERAAWGESGRHFGAAGFEIDETEGLAYLGKDRFGLPSDCAVVFGPNLFVEADGSTGRVEFPHGGLYPEEVLVPWLELARDRVTPNLKGTASGKAQTGKAGTITIRFENPAAVPIRLVGLKLQFGGQDTRHLPLEATLPPLDTTVVVTALENWPGKRQTGSARLLAELQMPNGLAFTCVLTSQLDAAEPYVRDLSQEDLRDLGREDF